MEDVKPIVIDNGSNMIKAGFAGDELPSVVFPSIIGRLRHRGVSAALGLKDCHYVGEQAIEKRGILTIKHPIECGSVTNWDDMTEIWFHTFLNKLKVEPNEHSILMTENPFNLKFNREKMTEIMFETLSIPAIYLANQPVLSLLASGISKGLVIDIGDRDTRISPVYEGQMLKNQIANFKIGGQDITDFLMKISCERGYSWTTTAERELIRDFKEKLGYIALDYDREMKIDVSLLEKNICLLDLPDQVLTYGNERFRSGEIIFQPKLIGYEFDGIHTVTNNAIMECDEKKRKDLYSNIVLAGGTALLPGLANRLKKEIQILSSEANINVISTEESKYSAWIGGSILASSSQFKSQWISKREYDECGPSIVHKKCF